MRNSRFGRAHKATESSNPVGLMSCIRFAWEDSITDSIDRQATASHCKGWVCSQSPQTILDKVECLAQFLGMNQRGKFCILLTIFFMSPTFLRTFGNILDICRCQNVHFKFVGKVLIHYPLYHFRLCSFIPKIAAANKSLPEGSRSSIDFDVKKMAEEFDESDTSSSEDSSEETDSDAETKPQVQFDITLFRAKQSPGSGGDLEIPQDVDALPEGFREDSGSECYGDVPQAKRLVEEL
ncbi:hypothetical protein KIN20_030475 [Parelaphostrongylus tenuis]|uniref:Uncharacterized protein n=1 Tax=Parelaphostrongylus tenuis TaxID=148309 RepID=A0AAD5WGB7_PARTN|nr:hypothetical protein KIN20_030475 [Parelaphostrongylus tenuis]